MKVEFISLDCPIVIFTSKYLSRKYYFGHQKWAFDQPKNFQYISTRREEAGPKNVCLDKICQTSEKKNDCVGCIQSACLGKKPLHSSSSTKPSNVLPYGPTEVKCRLLISSIFDVMNFKHFSKMRHFNL